MAEAYIGEIRLFAGDFAPRGWAICDGRLLPIAENAALFSILGTTYGGDGRNTFGLPDLRGRAPMHHGQGPGLTPRVLGEQGGSETVTLLPEQVPRHTHVLQASASPATDRAPAERLFAVAAEDAYGPAEGALPAPALVAPAGGGQPHENLQPQLAVTFIIALIGIFPSRG